MRHYEDAEQRAVIQWCELNRIPGSNQRIANFIFAIPNGGKRDKREAARLVKLGVKAGVSDLFLAYPCGSIHGYWIEMKKQRKDFTSENVANMAVTELQQEWLDRMSEVGFYADVCYGADEAIGKIKMYLGMPL